MQYQRDGSCAQSNRLAREKSPYLLQHAHNPVDWYPWGREAFDTAQEQNKPIFLSIGYSTCHWCHVMAHESFEDPEIAALMNDAFVNVKVDREERPDVDAVYMSACQALTGIGGWPLTIVATPEGKPFFAATYIPPETQFGRTGLKELIHRIKQLWELKRDDVNASADKVVTLLCESSVERGTADIPTSAIQIAYEEFVCTFDELHGGFGSAPKFPSPHNLSFLLRYWKRTGAKKALKMVEQTLQAMRRGGIYDHVGGGFHRYSTDVGWIVPHFEKMLYDQALLAMAYVETYQATGNEAYAWTAREIFRFVARELTSPEGGFYTAIDADSEGEEGKFYLWTDDEIAHVLTQEDAALTRMVFNIQPDGNFRDERTGTRTGENVLHMSRPVTALAAELNMPEHLLRERMEAIRWRLYEARKTRVPPQRDDKILADWNGLMIAALAKGARALDEPAYTTAATRAADFALARMRDSDGKLLHRFRDNDPAFVAGLTDYVFMTWGLSELYETTFETRHLLSALELLDHALLHFRDEKGGGFYSTADYAESLIFRNKDSYDGAIPSGNSAMLFDLAFLGLLTGKSRYLEDAIQLGRSLATVVVRAPHAYAHLLSGLDLVLGPSGQTILCGNSKPKETQCMLNALNKSYLPSNMVIFLPAEGNDTQLSDIIPGTQHKKCVDEKPTAYICWDFSCKTPITDISEMLRTLEEGGRRPTPSV
ncbi:MAG: thioredoxin domain-containing protein [Halobacteriota archaeon]